MSYPRICRFCNETAHETRLLQYGVRHYAHHHCFLDAGKKLADLHAWQVRGFPYKLLKDHGLLPEADTIVAKEAEREQAAARAILDMQRG